MENIFEKIAGITKPNNNINCTACGSTNVRMTDHQPLSMGEELAFMGMQFDTEMFAQFDCFGCDTSFQKMLTISFTIKL